MRRATQEPRDLDAGSPALSLASGFLKMPHEMEAQVWVPAAGVVLSERDGAAMLLSFESGFHFSLDRIGTRVWSHVTTGSSLRVIHDALIGEYALPADVLWSEMANLLTALA